MRADEPPRFGELGYEARSAPCPPPALDNEAVGGPRSWQVENSRLTAHPSQAHNRRANPSCASRQLHNEGQLRLCALRGKRRENLLPDPRYRSVERTGPRTDTCVSLPDSACFPITRPHRSPRTMGGRKPGARRPMPREGHQETQSSVSGGRRQMRRAREAVRHR
ncbi:hypothetical protein AAFF_G00217980 [Aldrovandia affinis]|uniref:Uncharacterized protein n=1 Tax=Aldrovandia affinis TaxID=143900 RepID=A0AAD7WVD5_9TELE|nr:hypothetical protein AAFF_G00217980 [Aldrovandia affinis]